MNTEEQRDAEMCRIRDIQLEAVELHAALLKKQKLLIEANYWRTCLNCDNFKEITVAKLPGKPVTYQHCSKFQAVPPPEVIVHGCKDHFYDDIPF